MTLGLFVSQVKHGAENMIETYNSGLSKDKKLLVEAQAMLADARRKIEYIRMQILRMHNQRTENGSDRAEGNNHQISIVDLSFCCHRNLLSLLIILNGSLMGRNLIHLQHLIMFEVCYMNIE